MPSKFDPLKSFKGKRKEVFLDVLARAIWMSYRSNHLVCEEDLARLDELTLDLAQQIRGSDVPGERMHLWFKKRFKMSGFRMDDKQIAALVPYLTGERKANWQLVEAVA